LIPSILSFSYFDIPSAEKGYQVSLAPAGWQMDVWLKNFPELDERHH